jgi:integrase
MANKPHPTRKTAQSKPPVARGDNQKPRSPEAIARLIALGVPKALADTFPLTPHPSGRFCKKLRTPHGPKVFYFGSVRDWQAALDRYHAEKEDLVAGRTPERRKDGLRLLDLLNHFQHFKRGLVATGELTMRSWYDYHQTGQRVLKVFGQDRLVDTLEPTDFEKLRADFATTWGPVRIGNEVNRTRMFFRFGFESGLMERPVRFGPAFKRPSRKTLRKVRALNRHKEGARMFTAVELRRVIGAAPLPMKAMVLLGINGGLSGADMATMPQNALDLVGGTIDFPRAKTGVERRIPLWPETVAAVRAWLAIRPQPKSPEDAHLLFLTKQRRPWYRNGRFVEDKQGGAEVKGIDNPVSKSFRVLLDKLGINGKRNFLALRHGFRTVARAARDREAVDFIMGHTDESMASHYIEDRLPDERLRGVTEYVRSWLFDDNANNKEGEKST